MGLAPSMGHGPAHGDTDCHKLPERLAYTLQVRAMRHCRIQRWALSLSLAVTWEILVSFFSFAY
jgi:hypothetical protein